MSASARSSHLNSVQNSSIMCTLVLTCDLDKVKIVDEPTYAFDSVDNARRYKFEIPLVSNQRPTSIHGVILNDEPIVVFGAGGGCSTVHEHSGLVLDSKLYLAVGDCIVCFAPLDQRLAWSTKVDSATCFGIYYNAGRHALLSHGELEIARINGAGEILWSSSGADIFSEGFQLEDEYVSAVDFEGREYRFSYDTGSSV
jgi:hypothetical protein